MDVRLPNGTLVTGVPDDYSFDDVADLAIDAGMMTLEEYSKASAAAEEPPEETPFYETDFIGNAFKGLTAGVGTTVPATAEGLGALSYATGMPVLPGMDPVTSLKDDELIQWGRQGQKELTEFIGGDTQSVAYRYGRALGSFGAYFIPVLGQYALAVRGLATAGRIAGLGGQTTLAVSQGASEQAERILNLTEKSGGEYPAAEEKLKQAIITGGAIGFSELGPARMFAKIISLGIPRSVPAETRNRVLANAVQMFYGTAPRRLGFGSAAEGAQEAIAGYLQDLTAKGLYDPTLEVGKSAAADFGYGASAAFTFQAALEAMMPGFRRRRSTPDVEPTQETEPQADVVPEETLALPAPPASSTPLLLQDLRDDSETFIQPNEPVAPLVEQTISDLAEDLPLSFNRGAIVAVDELGTPDAYSTNSNEKGFFVESKQGVKVSPYFGSSEQAAEFKDGLNLGVNDLLDTQDRAETNRLAAEAIKDAGYGPDSANVATGALLEAARQTQVTENITAGDLPGDTLTAINARRVQTGQRVFSPNDLLTPGDLAEAGVSSEIISEVAPSSFNEVTADDIRDLAEQKNILLEDAGFERFSQRLIGNASIDSPSVSPGQLGYLYETIQQMPVLPGDVPQRLPVIRKPEFSGSQYAAVISLANRKGSDGILKSEINKALDLKRGAPTEAIIQSGVQRGDLIEHPTRKNRWISRSSYEMESRNLDSPLRRGEQIEGEQRRSEEQEAESRRRAEEVAEATTRSALGPGIMIPRSREGAFAGSFDEATANLKARIANVTPTPDAQNRIDAIQESLKRELSRFQRALPEGVKVGDRLDVRLANSVFTPEGVPVEGEIDVDGDRIVITLALDLAEAGAKSDAEVKNNLRGVLNHEVIHALKSLNVLSPADFKILERYARKNSRKDSDKTFFEDISERYLEQNADGTYIVTGTNVPPTQELLVEESIADAFRYWAAGDIKVTGKPKSLFDRIVKFFRSLSSGFSNSNVNSAEQLFEGLRSPLGSMDVEGTAAETRDLARAEARAAERGQAELDFPSDVFVDPDGPKYSLYPAQLDNVARRILGADTVQDGNVVRRVRASDVPRELLSRYMQRRLSRDEESALDRQQAVIEGRYSLARKAVDPKDPVFSAKNSKHDDAKIAGKRVAPRGMARRLSVLDLLYNNDLPERRGNNVGYVSRILNARAKRILGRKTGDKGILIEDDTSYDNLISDVFAAEALAALEETGNAANWYSEKVSEAVDAAAQLYPEIKTDLDARFAFLAALSVTSQNTPVMENAVYTTEVYNYYRANGRFPEYSKGKHGPSMRDNFIMLNDLLDRMGPQGVRELFESQFTVKELKEAGYNPPSGENVDTVVYGSFLLGPKIGQGFYQNLNGNFEPVTIDMWLMRSIGRVTGRLIGKPELIQVQTDRLIEGLRADPEKRGSNFLIASLFDAKIDGDVDVVVEIADELRREHDRIFRTPEVRALYERKEYNKPEWAKAAEAIVTQQNRPQDAPSGGNFRNAVRRIMNKTRKKLANSGYDVTNADLQAILWYPEKNLYKKLGVRTKENLNIDYAQAFEKILEGGIELDAEGNVLQTVGRGGRAEAVDVAGRVEGDGREISEADGAQVKYSLSRPNETLLNFIKSNPEGFTVTVDGEAAPEGYVVAPIKDAEMVIKASELNENTVNEYAKMLYDVAQATGQKVYAGGWLNKDDNLYYLDAVNIYNDLDTALYIANSADQIAIFDLRTFNEIRTPEGIEQLKQSGAYSDNARDDARRSSDEAAQRFKEIRSQGEQKYSLPRNIEVQRRNVVKYTERIGAPLSAYAGKFLEKTNDPNAYSARLLVKDNQGKTHAADVMVPSGFDRVINDPANPKRSVGFGEKHFAKHQEKVPVNTYGAYNSIEDLAKAAMRAYWPFRNNPEAGGFTIKEQTGPTGNTRYRFEWQSEDFGYPAVFVFEPLYYDVLGPKFVRDNPSYAGKFTAQLVTGWIGSSDKVKDNPIPRPAVSINPDRTTQVQKSIDRGMNEAINPKEARKTARSILSLKKKYSLKNSGKQLNERQKKIVEDRISEKANDTFFGRIMKSFDMTDPANRSVGLKIRRQILDNYAGMRKNASDLEKKNIDVEIEAGINAAIAQLQRKSGIVQAALTVGPVIYNRGSVHAVSDKLVNQGPEEQRVHFEAAFDRLKNEAVIENYTNPITGETFTLRYENSSDLKGLAEVFQEIDENNLWKEFEGYSAARRASRLIQEGREKTFTQEEIDELIDIGRTVPAVERAFQQYQLWNTALINTMKDAGVISEEAAQIWIDNADYLPFWRQFYDNTGTVFEAGNVTENRAGEITYEPDMDSKANRIFDSMYGVNAPKRLKGGRPAYFVMINDVADTNTYSTYEAAENRREQLRKLNPGERIFVKKTNQRVESPIDNILRNLDAAITSSLTNVMAARAVRDLYRLGLAKKVGAVNHNGDEGLSLTTDMVGIRVNGQLVYYDVYDKTLLDTLKATGAVQMPGLDLLSTPANLLRELVTKDPGFMAANMLRDSVSSWATSGVTKIPGPGTVAGYVKAVTKAPEAEALEAYGVIGGYDAKSDKEAVKVFNQINRQRGRGGWNPVTWWRTWDKVSMASDSSSRLAVYNRILKDTGNVTNATLEALEIINFSRKGAHPGIRVAAAIIPFLNARAQGLDLLYRAGTRGNSGAAGGNITNAQRMRRFYFRGIALIALSAAYALAHVHDDPEEDPWYHNASEVDKDNYWIIPPTWFGLDSFFGIPALKIPIPFELGIIFKVIPERIIRFLHDQTDARENWQSFGRHITGTLAVGMPQFAAPVFDTYMNYNSFTGRPIQTYWDKNVRGYITRPGAASPLSIAVSKSLYENSGIDIGAKQIDYILRGYTGTLGSYAIMATDSLMRGPAGLAPAPSKRLHEYPVLSRFLQEEVGRGPLDAYYDLESQVSLYADSIKRLEDAGRFEQAEKERQRFPNIPIREDEIKSVKQAMNQLFKLEEQFENDAVMSADDKKAHIEEVRRLMNETVRYLYRDRSTILERAN